MLHHRADYRSDWLAIVGLSFAAVGWGLAASLALFVKLAAADSCFAGYCSYGYYTALVLEYHYINRRYLWK